MPAASDVVSSAVSDTGLTAVEEACGTNLPAVCEWVYNRTNNEFLADGAEWITGTPLRIMLILIVAFILGVIVRRSIRHFSDRLTQSTMSRQLEGLRTRGPQKFFMGQVEETKRAESRAKTIASVLSSIAFFTIWVLAFMMILGEVNINIGPLLAGAGIAGVAIGFGAQTIVRDFLSGVFMLIEDQFGVGDIIDVGPASGTVEKVSLRTTTLRDVTGTVWHIPNGEVHRVANKSQLWSRALLDVEVAYDSDLRFAEGVIQRVANEMWEDPEWGGDELMEEPEVWGVQSLGADGIGIRVVVKTEPATQWSVERELRLRIKEAFDEAGIEIPYPQRTIWIRNEGDHPKSPKPDPKTIKTADVGRYAKGAELADQEESKAARARSDQDADE